MIDPKNWFWLVGEKVYSSAKNAYVPADDAAYQAFVVTHGGAPKVDSEAEIWPYVSDVVPGWLFDGALFVQPTATTYTKTQLKAYAASARYDKETGGISVGGVDVRTDRESQAMINGAYNMAARDGTFTTKWKGANGSFSTLTAATITALATAIGQHVAACFSAEADVVAQVDAGTLTTTTEINAAFAAITT